jgi:hypothetical protein
MVELTPEEKSRIYAEEKARLEAQALIQSEQKKKSGPGCGMLVLICLGVVVFIFVFLLVLSSIPSKSPSSYVSVPEIKKPETHALSYEVLRQWTPGKSGTGLELLVSPTATKKEVLQLANELKYEYIEYGQEVIFIFDSRDAWANRDNDRYPEAEYFKHFLVAIYCPPLSGQETVTWMAKGRN